jgi:hypothetical protein
MRPIRKSNFMIKQIVIIVVSIFFQACYGNNVITLPYITNDIAYSKIHGKLYALVDAMDPQYGNRLIEININTGVVERSQFAGSGPSLMRLTSDENFAWISFAGTPYIKRIDLNTFEIDKERYLGPSKKYTSKTQRVSSVFAYNFTVFQDQENKLALGLKTPFVNDHEALALFKNDTLQPRKIPESASMPLPFCFEPVLNGNYLVGHYQSSSISVYSRIRVYDNGLEFMNGALSDSGGFTRNWFKVFNDTLFAGIGTILDATDSSGLKVLGNCDNDIIGDRYGFAYSTAQKAFVYPNMNDTSLYLTFYNKETFKAFDSVYLFDYPFYELLLILELEVIDSNRFALLIGKDYGDFTVRIVEINSSGIGPPETDPRVEVFPNPASGKLFINGFPVNKNICVYDIAGKLVGAYERSGIKAEINLANYHPGIYLVRINDIDNHYNSVVKKIVIP